MFDALYRIVARFATWPVIALLFIAYVLATQGFEARHAALGYDTRILDVRFAYSPDDARAFFEELGMWWAQPLRAHRNHPGSRLSSTYNGLLALLIFNLWTAALRDIFSRIPLLTAVDNLLENVTIASWPGHSMAAHHPWLGGIDLHYRKASVGAVSSLRCRNSAVRGVWQMWHAKDAIR